MNYGRIDSSSVSLRIYIYSSLFLQAELKDDDHLTKVKMYFWNGNLMDHNTMGFFPFQLKCDDNYPLRY